MKKAKIVKVEKKEEIQDISDKYSLKDLIKIILILVIVFTIFYFITTLVVKPSKNKNTNNGVTIIDSTKIILNHLLDRSENEYYVLAIKERKYDNYVTKINYTDIYNTYISNYKNKDGSLKFYTVNLDDALNKNYIADTTNITSDLSNLKLSDEVLFKIKAGNIENYYIGRDAIIDALSNL